MLDEEVKQVMPATSNGDSLQGSFCTSSKAVPASMHEDWKYSLAHTINMSQTSRIHFVNPNAPVSCYARPVMRIDSCSAGRPRITASKAHLSAALQEGKKPSPFSAHLRIHDTYSRGEQMVAAQRTMHSGPISEHHLIEALY